jgi:methionyl-tRNA synthetase
MTTEKFKRTIITSALPYVNNVPHLGTVVCIISADCYSRYLKSKGEDVLFVCGTDEHGTTAEVKALEEGVTPRQLVDKYFKIHKNIYEWFNCKFDCFGRTSSSENKEISIDIFNKLDENGYIKQNTLQQTFCSNCDKFLSDRYVEGICPHCNYEEARGDQCEHCGKLLNAIELKKPKCKICSSTPVIKDTNHLFIDLPKIESKLKKWVNGVESNWSANAKTMTQAWFREGLKERCITRDLKWGIKVPKKGYENKVFYSWFDAPIGYIGITHEHKKNWHSLWHSAKDTRLVQFMGKDNIPFHSILFPAFLIGTNDDYTLLNNLSVNEYLNYESGKFSKSRGEGIFGDDAIKSGICSDAYRYYILINRPEQSDTVFTWNDFMSKINNELVSNLGNLVNRTVVFVNRFFEGCVPEGSFDSELKSKLDKEYKKIEKKMDSIQLKDALKDIMNVCKIGNQFFQEKEPWKTKDKEAMFTLVNLVKDIGILIEPYLPDTSKLIFKQLNVSNLKWNSLGKIELKKGHKIKTQELLFKKLEDKDIIKLKNKFGGEKKMSNSENNKENKFMLNLKVAKIVEIKDHPDADKLYVAQIDLGTEKRQLIAGLKEYYSKDELLNRKIVVVTNLKPVKLRGELSQGMLLAGDDGDNVKLVSVEKSNPGDPVTNGLEINDSEISFDEFMKIKLSVKDHKVLADGKVLKTNSEELSCDLKDGAKVR